MKATISRSMAPASGWPARNLYTANGVIPSTVIAPNMTTVARWKSALILSFHISTFADLARRTGRGMHGEPLAGQARISGAMLGGRLAGGPVSRRECKGFRRAGTDRPATRGPAFPPAPGPFPHAAALVCRDGIRPDRCPVRPAGRGLRQPLGEDRCDPRLPPPHA